MDSTAAAQDQPKTKEVVKSVKTQSEEMAEAIVEIYESKEFNDRFAKQQEDISAKLISAPEPFGDVAHDPGARKRAAIRLSNLSEGSEKLRKEATESEGREQIILALLDLPPLLTERERNLSRADFKASLNSIEFNVNVSEVVKAEQVDIANARAVEALSRDSSRISTTGNHVEAFIWITDFRELHSKEAAARSRILRKYTEFDEQQFNLQAQQTAATPAQAALMNDQMQDLEDRRLKFIKRIEELEEEKKEIDNEYKAGGDSYHLHKLSFESRSLDKAIELLTTMAVNKQNISLVHLKRLEDERDDLRQGSSSSKQRKLDSIEKQIEILSQGYFTQASAVGRLEVRLSRTDLSDTERQAKTAELSQAKTELASREAQAEAYFGTLSRDYTPPPSLAIDEKFRAVTSNVEIQKSRLSQAPEQIAKIDAEIAIIQKSRSQASDILANLDAFIEARYAKHAMVQSRLVKAIATSQHNDVTPDVGSLVNTNIPPKTRPDNRDPFYRVMNYYYEEKQKISTTASGSKDAINDIKIKALLRFFGSTEKEAVRELRRLIKGGGDSVLPVSVIGDGEEDIDFGEGFDELLRGNAYFAAAAKMLILVDKEDKGQPLVYRDLKGNWITRKEVDEKYNGNANLAVMNRELLGPAEGLIKQAYKGQWFDINGSFGMYNTAANKTAGFPRNTYYFLRHNVWDKGVAWGTTAIPFIPAALTTLSYVSSPSGFATWFTGISAVAMTGSAGYYTWTRYGSTSSEFELNKNRSAKGNWLDEKYIDGIRHGETPVISKIRHINPRNKEEAKAPGAWKGVMGRWAGKTAAGTAVGAAIGGWLGNIPGAILGAKLGSLAMGVVTIPPLRALASGGGKVLGIIGKIWDRGWGIAKLTGILYIIDLAVSFTGVRPQGIGVVPRVNSFVGWAASAVGFTGRSNQHAQITRPTSSITNTVGHQSVAQPTSSITNTVGHQTVAQPTSSINRTVGHQTVAQPTSSINNTVGTQAAPATTQGNNPTQHRQRSTSPRDPGSQRNPHKTAVPQKQALNQKNNALTNALARGIVSKNGEETKFAETHANKKGRPEPLATSIKDRLAKVQIPENLGRA